jgi:hypothetical protein
MSSSVQEIVPTPDMTGTAGSVTRVPVTVLNLVWEYVHYPTAWDYTSGEWLPQLAQLNFRNGLNGQSDASPHAARQHAMGKGATLIPPNHPKLGRFRNYRATVPAYDPNSGAVGQYYCAAWERPTMVGNRNVRWDVDTATFTEFRRLLVSSGIIEPISRVVAETKVDQLAGTLDHLRVLPANGQRSERIATAEALLDAMRASLDSILDVFDDAESAAPAPVQPAPTTRRRRLGAPTTGAE